MNRIWIYNTNKMRQAQIQSAKRIDALIVLSQHKGKYTFGFLIELFSQGKYDAIINYRIDNRIMYVHEPDRTEQKQFIY